MRFLKDKYQKIKLHYIQKAFNIQLYKWQKDYILNRSQFLPTGRRNGKTLCCNIWYILNYPTRTVSESTKLKKHMFNLNFKDKYVDGTQQSCFPKLDKDYDLNPHWHIHHFQRHVDVWVKYKNKNIICKLLRF